MKHLEVSGAVRRIYIYVIRRLKFNNARRWNVLESRFLHLTYIFTVYCAMLSAVTVLSSSQTNLSLISKYELTSLKIITFECP